MVEHGEFSEAEYLAADKWASDAVGWFDEPNESTPARRVMTGQWDEETKGLINSPAFIALRNTYAEKVRAYLFRLRAEDEIHTKVVWTGSEEEGRFITQYPAPTVEVTRSSYRTDKWRARHRFDVTDEDGNPIWFETADKAKNAGLRAYEAHLVECVEDWTRAFGFPPARRS